MYTVRGKNINEVWIDSLELLKKEGQAQESRDQKTVELIHVGLEIIDPRQRVVFARDINPAFAIVEVIANLAGSNDVSFLGFWNKKMNDFSDEGRPYFHGAYGYRLMATPDINPNIAKKLRHPNAPAITSKDQLKKVLSVLLKTRHSRQAVLQYWDSNLDLPDPDPKSNDVACNLVSHLMIRGGKLEWLQVMRSNDMIWGLPYDCIQFTALQEIMAGWLNVEVGTYNHVSDSLHLYERHFDYLKNDFKKTDIPVNGSDLRIGPYEKWEDMFREVVDVTVAFSEHCREKDILDELKKSKNMPKSYCEWINLLAAERLRMIGANDSSLAVIKGAGVYWETSWKQWFESKTKK